MKLRNKFRERREELGLSIVDMAKKSGLSRPTIMKYENSNDNQITKLINAYEFRLEPIEPADPLIKDEKDRKAVIFKAEALAGAIEQSVKEFIDDIAELCGEEEE